MFKALLVVGNTIKIKQSLYNIIMHSYDINVSHSNGRNIYIILYSNDSTDNNNNVLRREKFTIKKYMRRLVSDTVMWSPVKQIDDSFRTYNGQRPYIAYILCIYVSPSQRVYRCTRIASQFPYLDRLVFSSRTLKTLKINILYSYI